MESSTNFRGDHAARVYRFHDHVALLLPDQEAVYIPANEAMALSHALAVFGRDIAAVKFTSSDLGTVTIGGK